MRQQRTNHQPGSHLPQVSRFCNDNWSQLPSDRFTYHVVWIQKTPSSSTKHLYVLRPGMTFDGIQLGHSTGFHVSFREEMLLILGCEHYLPFCTRTASRQVSVAEMSTPRLIADLDALMTKLVSTASQPGKHQISVLYGLLKVFLIYVSRHMGHAESSDEDHPADSLYARFIRLLYKDQFEKKAVNEYADTLSVSTNTLNSTIKKMSGYTVSQHIQQCIILKAKQAAITSQASMKEVAFDLGFQDIAHFSKYFRLNAGMTFSDFKRTFQIL
jgi:AraC family transcriptional activator of pobA